MPELDRPNQDILKLSIQKGLSSLQIPSKGSNMIDKVHLKGYEVQLNP